MAVTIYYSSFDNVIFNDPEPLASKVVEMLKGRTRSLQCPAFKEYFKNTYVIKYPFDYQIGWNGRDITSNMYDQVFFNKAVIIRDPEAGYFSLLHPTMVFYTDSEDLEMEILPAYFHKNELTTNGFLIPGTFNIGKHLPRKLEAPYKLASKVEINIQNNDALYYIKFKTKEKIEFKKFIMTKNITDIVDGYLSLSGKTIKIRSLQWWYDLISRNRLKKYFIKEIKKNLL
jgi:hypothetical protein